MGWSEESIFHSYSYFYRLGSVFHAYSSNPFREIEPGFGFVFLPRVLLTRLHLPQTDQCQNGGVERQVDEVE